jgi:hypothetical protein
MVYVPIDRIHPFHSLPAHSPARFPATAATDSLALEAGLGNLDATGVGRARMGGLGEPEGQARSVGR